ncbi:hypothetical protein F4554_001341 [Actinopolymorpha rutila]|uniref:Uncharacterized protein n=1 Tax=Actinopolymorpha rutila TaxID=446787 RepID=A0A852Z8K8_9ACTN|nr:hypothetical protein [Actinopolymorpha rutila]
MPEQRPAPPVELLEWPTADPSLPAELFRLPAEREVGLAKRLPAPGPNARANTRPPFTWSPTMPRSRPETSSTGLPADSL